MCNTHAQTYNGAMNTRKMRMDVDFILSRAHGYSMIAGLAVKAQCYCTVASSKHKGQIGMLSSLGRYPLYSQFLDIRGDGRAMWCGGVGSGSLKRVPSDARKNAQKFWSGKRLKNEPNISSDVLETFWLRCRGALGRSFGRNVGDIKYTNVVCNLAACFACKLPGWKKSVT